MLNKNAKQITINRILIIVAVICSIFAVGMILLPFINNASLDTQIKGSNDMQINYTSTESNTWDVSENGDGSVIATLDENGLLNITGTGRMKDWDFSSTIDWHNSDIKGTVKKVVINEGVTSIGGFAFSECSSLTEITIPEGVTRIRQMAFEDCSSLTEITIPSSVTSIGNYAFYGCSSLTEITIPEGVTSIGMDVFDACSSLTEITIPSSVTSIGNSAFSRCRSLREIKVDNDNINYCDEDGVLHSKDKTEIIKYPEGKKDTTYIILNGVTSIGNDAFRGCSSLTEITIPEGVTSIGAWAFFECSCLTEITIPSSVTSIGSYVFERCKITSFTNSNIIELPDILKRAQDETDILYSINGFSLTNCTIEDSNVKINEGVSDAIIYVKDGALKGLTYIISYSEWDISENGDGNVIATLDENGLLTISGTGYMKDWNNDNNAPWYSVKKQIKQVKIEEGVTNISDFAFNGCSSLTEITIPSSVTSIGSDVFYECSSLTEITIPEGVTSIGSYAFSKCSSLREIKIPEGVTSIGSYAFYGCSSLTEIKIPEGVTRISDMAFYVCSSLTEITIPNSVTSIGNHVFSQCSSLTQIKVDSNNIKYCDNNGVLYSKDKTEIIKYPEGKKDATYTILKGVTSIGWFAFEGCSSLTEITISEGVTRIRTKAFEGCINLTEITIPSSVTSIESDVFDECSSLIQIKVDSNNTKYCDDNGVLYSKDKTEIIQYPEGKKDNTYTILNGVTSIGSYAFSGCSSLTEIVIPKGITSIGWYAFYRCTNLTIICKSNTTAETYAQDNGINYIVDDDGPIIEFSINGTSAKVISANTQVIVEDIVAGVDESSLKYFWGTEIEGVSEDQITTSFTKDETIITPQNSGNYYLWILAKDLVGNTTIERSNAFVIDIDPPTANVTYKLSSKKDNCTVEIIVNEEIQEVEGWTISTDKKTIVKTYKRNTTEDITIKDVVGNETTVKIEIKSIEDVLEMSSYEIKGKYIGKINPKTLFKDFIKSIYTNMEYKLKEGDKTVADTSIMKTGQTLTIGNKSYTIVVRGDINGDGKVGIAELARTSRLGISQEGATEIEIMAIDINMDGNIKVNDIAAISRMARE